MRSDRLIHVLLIIIAAGLCIGATVWVGVPMARATDSAHTQLDGLPPQMTSQPRLPGPATLPLRWRIAYVRQTASGGSSGTFCGTAVLVWNTTPSTVSAQLEVFDSSGSVGYTQQTIPAHDYGLWWTNNSPSLHPISGPGTILGFAASFYGFATLHASDPRIITSAYLVCRADASTGALTGLVNIMTLPVGATIEFFHAGMPATWTPPMAKPEVPE